MSACAASALAIAVSDLFSFKSISLSLVLGCLIAVSSLLALTLTDKSSHFPETTLLVCAVLVLEPGLAVFAALAGTVIALVLMRRPLRHVAVNGSNTVLVIAGCSTLLLWSGWRADFGDLGIAGYLLMIGLLAVVIGTLQSALSRIVRLDGDDTTFENSRLSFIRRVDRGEIGILLTQVPLGVLATDSINGGRWITALLFLAVGVLVRTLHDQIGMRRNAERESTSRAFNDSLTGLPNRSSFLDFLDQALIDSRKSGAKDAVLLVDLDRFKFVNDSIGHMAADHLLREVADRLSSCARPTTIVARLGGDQFGILLRDFTDLNESHAMAATIADALDLPFVAGDREFAITTSIGIVVPDSTHVNSSDVIRDAEFALRRAKEQGKAQCALFEAALGTSVRELAELESDLGKAATQGELRLAFQPLVELTTGTVVGVEALIRWEHPIWGLLQPGAFIPMAEETGLIEPIGRWVLIKACRQGRLWQSKYANPPVISVNLSACQFQEPGLVELVGFVLSATGLDPQLLKLEITESAVMADAARAVDTLKQLKELGVGLAIDDFGTGYSSLNYLRRFQVDALKIDRAFVSGLGSDGGDRAIVEAVVGLAHTLGLEVVAEGIETTEQVLQLRAMGCEQGQGFHFGRPQSASSIEALLEKVTYAVGPRVRLTG